MTQRSWLWGGTATGDAALPAPYGAPYSDDMFTDLWAILFTRDRAKQGVISSARTGFDGLLAATNPAGMTIRIASGAALVDGKLYHNDSNVDFTVVTPGAGTNYYLISLRKSFATQEVRLFLSAPSLAAYPSPVQTDGVTWDLPLHRVSVSNAGVVTITDQRQWVLRTPLKREYHIPTYVYNATDAEEQEPIGSLLGNPIEFSQGHEFNYGINYLIPDDYSSGLSIKLLIQPNANYGDIPINIDLVLMDFDGNTIAVTSYTDTLTVTDANLQYTAEIASSDLGGLERPGLWLKVRYTFDNTSNAYTPFMLYAHTIEYLGI